MFTKAKELEKNAAKKVAEKQVESALGKAAGVLAIAIGEFIKPLAPD